MTPIDLVRLTALRDRTSGSPDVVVGLIDGPVAVDHPASQRFCHGWAVASEEVRRSLKKLGKPGGWKSRELTPTLGPHQTRETAGRNRP